MTATAPLDHLRRLRRDGRLVVIDGGMGSELEAQGATMDHHAWSGLVNLTDPALVRRVHEDYVAAGADVLITNTFMSGTGPMERAGAGERFELANRTAVRVAREAAVTAERPIAIAGSVAVDRLGAPETASGGAAPDGDQYRRLRDGYARQIEVLAAEGVDLIALEMVDHPRYAEPAVEAALGLVGESWDGPLGAYPHHGVWLRPSWQFLDLPAERLVELARRWRTGGVGMIGGCCGIGPRHIAALRGLDP
jgi:methionine synthase I (cobalamin-dependent)